MFNKIIELKGLTDNGTSPFRSVYAKEKSIPQSEFFAAAQGTIQPSTCFIVRSCEYNGEEFIRYSGKIYHIYRIFNTKNMMCETWCEFRIGDQKWLTT